MPLHSHSTRVIHGKIHDFIFLVAGNTNKQKKTHTNIIYVHANRVTNEEKLRQQKKYERHSFSHLFQLMFAKCHSLHNTLWYSFD